MSTITTIQPTDLITDSRANLNDNFANLNADKIETSVLDTDTTLAANSDAKVATQAAVKAYVDAGGNVNATETTKGIVEIATAAEVAAGTATGATGASLVVTPNNLPGTEQIVYDVADSPATWTKQTGLKRAKIQVWGGGGSGASRTTAALADYSSGGSGGEYIEIWLEAAALGATETVTIGAGGAGASGNTQGNDGSVSSFGSILTVLAGLGGSSSTSARPVTVGVGNIAGSATDKNGYIWGSGAGGESTGNTSDFGGNSLYGGAGGGGARGSDSGGVGGTSSVGGNGSAGVQGASAAAASTPAGGGGGCCGGTSGAGGGGQVIVTEYYV
jgi:hypothetical protein